MLEAVIVAHLAPYLYHYVTFYPWGDFVIEHPRDEPRWLIECPLLDWCRKRDHPEIILGRYRVIAGVGIGVWELEAV